ncbi:MAG: hypothetical protein ABDH18_06400 [Aquificaceae bacterium]
MTEIIAKAYLILSRAHTPESDIFLRVYGQAGQIRILVPSELNLSAGLFEPGNLIWIEIKQSGDWAVLKDISRVEMISLLALRDYERYLWICYIINFVKRWFYHFDKNLFEFILKQLKKQPSEPTIDRLKFELEAIEILGLYSDKNLPNQILNEIKLIKSGKLGPIKPEIVSKIREYIYSQLSTLE